MGERDTEGEGTGDIEGEELGETDGEGTPVEIGETAGDAVGRGADTWIVGTGLEVAAGVGGTVGLTPQAGNMLS